MNQLNVIAYMHPTSSHCISTDPLAYKKSIKLVKLTDAQDEVDKINELLSDETEGLEQWRSIALQGIALAKLVEALKNEPDQNPFSDVVRSMAAALAIWPT